MAAASASTVSVAEVSYGSLQSEGAAPVVYSEKSVNKVVPTVASVVTVIAVPVDTLSAASLTLWTHW